MAKLYVDENFPRPTVQALRELGHDVVTPHEAARANQRVPDRDVLADACTFSRVLVTLNRRDFIRLHQQSTSHRGIVVCSVDADFAALGSRIDRAIRTFEPLAGRLIRANRESVVIE